MGETSSTHAPADGLRMYDDDAVVPYVAPPYVRREPGWHPITDSSGVVFAHGQSLPVPRLMVQGRTDALRSIFQRILRRIVV